MELSEIKSVDVQSIRVTAKRSPLMTKALSLNPGQGFEVKGKSREEFNYVILKAKKEGKTLSTKKLGPQHFLIFRYA